MGGTHACSVSVSATVGTATFTGMGIGVATDGILGPVSVTLLPAGGTNPFTGPLDLTGLPCPVRGSIRLALPLAGGIGTVTLVITAVD